MKIDVKHSHILPFGPQKQVITECKYLKASVSLKTAFGMYAELID